jgi:hypothetical protein
MDERDATTVASHEKQAKRMDALAATAPQGDMKEAFRKLATSFRTLAQKIRDRLGPPG